MLSTNLEMLRAQLSARTNAQGEVLLTAHEVRIVDLCLVDAVDDAKQMEASRVRSEPVLVDISDPKIALHPTRKRPVAIPIRTPDDGDAA